MITIGLIRNGATYLSQHLRKNDYWAEGEKAVIGEWIGEGAAMLNLSGEVQSAPFEALRQNLHPLTNEPLTPRNIDNRVAFFDIQFSAPKDVSVLAMVGGDERVRVAFHESVKVALAEMERFAAVRERRGFKSGSEEIRLTGNVVGATFLHDTSRDLDPQLHVHAVLANASWSAERKQWLALKQNEMLRASPYIRQVLYRELASRLRALGYDPHEMNKNGFSVRGVEHLRERFSKRAQQIKGLSESFATEKGRKPTSGEIAVLVRESRSEKLSEISTAAVRAKQRDELSAVDARSLDHLVDSARRHAVEVQLSQGNVSTVLEAAFRHAFERASVVREGLVLSDALELHPDFYGWRELREALGKHADVIRYNGEMTLRQIRKEETRTVERARTGRNQWFELGASDALPESLTAGQRRAATELLKSRDFVSVLIGDAGTGKTTVLTAIEKSHVARGGQSFIALAPTTRARDALKDSGFDVADTVQRFLVSKDMQATAVMRVILVDEAGLLSTAQLDALTQKASDFRARLLLVGDTKQHYSVQRGDGLRNVVKNAGLPIVRLTEVLRQRNHWDRNFSRLLAAGDAGEAILFAERRGFLREVSRDDAMFKQAADHYVANRSKKIDTLVVIPFWEEIYRFNSEVRPALRRAGLLGDSELVRTAVKPLSWTLEQKQHWSLYQPGDRLLFTRKTRSFSRGTTAEIVTIASDGLVVRDSAGQEVKVTKKQRAAFEVGRAEALAVSVGDRLLIRGRDEAAKLANGDLREVTAVDPISKEVLLDNGKHLPHEFTAWTYGHAVTSYRAQGSTSEESILVLGSTAAQKLSHRELYVGNTRYRGAHAIYVTNTDELYRRLAWRDNSRELASEFVQRQRWAIHQDLRNRQQQAVQQTQRI